MTQEKEMSFLDHLEELRWHLVRSVAAIFVISIVLFSIQEYVYNEFLLAHIDPNFIITEETLLSYRVMILEK